MREKLDVKRVANSVALTTAIAYIVCILVIWIFPGLAGILANYLMHGVEITIVSRSLGFSIVSLILGTILGWIIGALFAWTYNKIG